MLALAAITALELTCWLSPGLSNRDRSVTAIAAILQAAPIAVRRVWPAAALVFSMAVVTVSMPFGGQLLSNDNAYVIPRCCSPTRRAPDSRDVGAWLP